MPNNISLLTKDSTYTFLSHFPLGTIATVNEMGAPEAVAVYFYTERDFTLYFVTKAETRKLQNILRRPTATILSYDEASLTSVELTGNVEIIRDAVEFAQVIEKFHSIASSRRVQYWLPPIAQIDAGNYVACKLLPTSIYYRSFSKDVAGTIVPQEAIFGPEDIKIK